MTGEIHAGRSAESNDIRSEYGEKSRGEWQMQKLKRMSLWHLHRHEQLEAEVHGFQRRQLAQWLKTPPHRAQSPLFDDENLETVNEALGVKPAVVWAKEVSRWAHHVLVSTHVLPGVSGPLPFGVVVAATALEGIVRGIRPRLSVGGPPGDLSPVENAVRVLEEDFEDLDLRLVRAANLEEALGNLERALEGSGAKYVRRVVGLVRDVLNFNYSEDLTASSLAAIKHAVRLVRERGESITREDYRRLHKHLVSLGLCVVPTSTRALAEFGEGQQVDAER